MRSLLLFAIALGLSTFQVGCNASRGGFAGSRLARFLPPIRTAEPGADGSSDPWIQQAASEGRREYAVEKANDPLGLRKYVMSDRAREIERNVGIID